MTPNDVIQNMFKTINPQEIPAKYIAMARFIDASGRETNARGAQIGEVLRNIRESDIVQIKMVINEKKIRKAIASEMTYIYDMLQQEFEQQIAD